MGLLWREYPRRKPSLKKPRGWLLGACQGMGECKPRFQKCYRSTGWDGEEAGGLEPTLAPVYVAPALCWLQVSGEASLTRASPGHKLSTWMSSSRYQWT